MLIFHYEGGTNMKCPYCDYENKDTSKFCENCGAKLIEEDQARDTSDSSQNKKFENQSSDYTYHSENERRINDAHGNEGGTESGYTYSKNSIVGHQSKKKKSKIGIAVLILGLLGFCGGWLSGIIAIVIGIFDLVKNRDKKHVLTIIGLVLACIGLFNFAVNKKSAKQSHYSKPEKTIESTTETIPEQNVNLETTSKPEPTETPVPEVVHNEFISGEIFNDYGVSIVADKIVYGSKTTTFSFVLENTSDSQFEMAAHAFAVNGIMAGGSQFGSQLSLSSNSKAKLDCTVDNDWLTSIGATSIDSFDISFWAYQDLMKAWGTEVISVPIEIATESAKLSGDPIYEDDFVTVSILDASTDHITYYVQNHSGYYSYLEVTDCSVDGWAYDLGSSKLYLNDELVFKDHAAILTLNIDRKFLNDSGIDSPSTVNMKLGFRESEPESYSDVWKYTTDVISVNFS